MTCGVEKPAQGAGAGAGAGADADADAEAAADTDATKLSDRICKATSCRTNLRGFGCRTQANPTSSA